MSAKVLCREHGDQAWAAVCRHVADTVGDGIPRGFAWVVDEEGAYQVLCDACEALNDAEWERVRSQVHTIICLECCRRAAAINHVELPRS